MHTDHSNALSSLLRKFAPFTNISDDQLNWLAKNSRPFHCSVGQSILLSDRQPDNCYCIVEGRGRLLHHDPSLRRPVTLAYAQPGDLIGWAGLVRRSPCEWVTAATPLKLIGFSAEVFYHLEDQSSEFRHWLDTNNSPAEIMDILKFSLRSRPNAEPQEREVLRRLIPSMQLLSARDIRELPDQDDSLYLWNSQLTDFDLPIGQEVDNYTLKSIPIGFPLRLIRVDPSRWENELRPPLIEPPQTSNSSSLDIWDGDRYQDLLDPLQDLTDDSPVTDNSSSSNHSSGEFVWKGKRLKVLTGTLL